MDRIPRVSAGQYMRSGITRRGILGCRSSGPREVLRQVQKLLSRSRWTLGISVSEIQLQGPRPVASSIPWTVTTRCLVRQSYSGVHAREVDW